LPAEQKGNHSWRRGCKDQLLISKATFEDSKKRKKNLSIAWIDYRKALDSVPHSWIEKSTELLGWTTKVLTFANHQLRNGAQDFSWTQTRNYCNQGLSI
jgi:Ni,Fe-hydrogenase I large subunit